MSAVDIEPFGAAIEAAGLLAPPAVLADGKLHRFSTNGKDRDDSGWYVLHGDGIPAGAFGDWRTGVSETWRADIGRPLTSAEQAALRVQLDEIRRAREVDEKERHAEARREAEAIWKRAKLATDQHPYLTHKRVRAYGLRVHPDGRLIVPVHCGETLHSLQFIDGTGEKRFLASGRVKGCYHTIGTLQGATTLCIAEGYATGATIHMATGNPVVVAFNAGNLLAVAQAIRARFPELPLVVCADDDIDTSGNPGRTKAMEAARTVDACLAVPEFGTDRPAKASDFNDLAVHRELETVRAAIAAARPVADAESGDDKTDAPASAGTTAGRRATLVRVADVEAETITWIWFLRLARGKLTLFAGDPGAGKTYLALAVSAALSRGWPLPGETSRREPCDVVYMTKEDGIGDTLRPRLDALGADATRVHVFAGADDGRDVSLADIDVIGDAVTRTGAGLVVVDPLQSWLGSRVDAHRSNQTRPLLDALGALCARHRCACLVIAHTAKNRGGRPVTAALGSIDFAGAARIMLVAGSDPEDRTRSVLAAAKTNIGAMPASIAYSIDRETGIFMWGGAVELSAAEVLAGDNATEDERDALSEAVEWLRAELAEGPRPAREMERAARAANIVPATLRRARRTAGVRSRRRGFGPGAEYVWALMHVIDAHTVSMSTHDAHGGHDAVENGVI